MDGFDSNHCIIVIAATNRPDILDSALKRPGRFDRTIVINPPAVAGREEILKIHTRGKNKVELAESVNLNIIAKGTPGFTGAELESLVNEAALLAGRKGKDSVSQSDFELAKDKILMGPEQKSIYLTPENKRITAIHEAGHAFMNIHLKNDLDTLHKVSIVPRSQSLGVTMTIPKSDDDYNYTKSKCISLISMMMGGRVAEHVFFNEISSGASNDIIQATNIARNMVYSWGMSKMGPIHYENKNQYSHQSFSEEIRGNADKEVVSIIIECLDRTMKIIQDNKIKIERIASLLIKEETIDGSQVSLIVSSS